MMIAESSSYTSMDEQIRITNASVAAAALKNSKFLSSVLSPSLSPPSSSSFLSSQSQIQEQQQQQHQQQQSLPDRSTSLSPPPPSSSSPSSTTNVFKNFPKSCCCRQMMMAATTATVKTSPTTAAVTATIDNNSCKKSLKDDNDGDSHGVGGISGSSTFRQFLPIALCILSFATVLSILIVYMDTTEIRHQQFRLNMSRDYELYGVSQDDPTLIAFLREIHMKKYPMNFLKNTPIEHYNFTAEQNELTLQISNYISSLINNKLNGVFIQSVTGSTSNSMTAPWLSETLNWSGLIIEPEPRRYFSLRKQNVHRPKVQIVHACLSPSGYPKEVRLHNEEDSEVRINSLLDEEATWFNSRVKCFPLYTLMLAINKIDYDLLSLGCPEHELQILETLPFNKVNIEVISIHLTENRENVTEYIRNITKFLFGKSYKLQKRFENNYIYQKINSSTRTKKQMRGLPSSLSSLSATTSPSTTPRTTMTAIAKTHQQDKQKSQ